jgi:hypothetical protein
MTRLQLDVVRTEAGRLKGRLVTDDGTTNVRFDGTLELLRILEETVNDDSTTPNPPLDGRGSGVGFES